MDTSHKLAPAWGIGDGKQVVETFLVNHKTCLVMTDSFYEWKEMERGDKQPYRFTVKDRKLFCFAGLWSQWVDPETKEKFRTYGILTTEANPLVADPFQKAYACNTYETRRRYMVE